MAWIISLAERREARQRHVGQDGRCPSDGVAGDGTPCSVLLFTGIRYEHADAASGWVERPWLGRIGPRDAEPGTS